MTSGQWMVHNQTLVVQLEIFLMRTRQVGTLADNCKMGPREVFRMTSTDMCEMLERMNIVPTRNQKAVDAWGNFIDIHHE